MYCICNCPNKLFRKTHGWYYRIDTISNTHGINPIIHIIYILFVSNCYLNLVGLIGIIFWSPRLDFLH